MKQRTFFEENDRLKRLSDMGDPLEKVAVSTNWETFRPKLNKVFKKERRGAGGRPPFDYVMMFKILLLQQWYNIADDITEYVINDRLSFQRFLGLSLGDKVPDAKTIWLFRENIRLTGADKELFYKFNKDMSNAGLITKTGSIIDATFIESPKQHNTKEENKQLKEGQTPKEWEENPHKLSQKDMDSSYTKKGNEIHYGYKDHIKVDKDSKLIVDFSVTSAKVHDNNVVADLVDETDNEMWLDTGYAGKNIEQKILAKNPNIKLHTMEKATRNHPLTDEQKAKNREKSRVRVRCEHVFGFMTNTMNTMNVNCVGIARATTAIALKNLAYNIRRHEFLQRKQVIPNFSG